MFTLYDSCSVIPRATMTADIRKFLTGVKKSKEEESKFYKNVKKSVAEDVREKKLGFVNPVMIKFQNGNLTDNKTSDFVVELTVGNNGRINVEAESSHGHVFKNSNASEMPGLTQIIAIRNKKTNKVKLVEVDSAILINSALVKSRAEPTLVADYQKNIKDLHKTFGGKKKIIQLDQKEKVNVNSMVTESKVKESVADVEMTEDTSFKNKESESIADLTPPCNRQTKVLSEVYILRTILTESELESLKTELSKMEETKLNLKGYSQFFLNCYTEAMKTKNDLDNRLAGLLFAEILIQFLKLPSKKLKTKSAVFCLFCSSINEKIANEFCVRTESSLNRPLAMRDKSLCYIIAIALICCDYQINLKLLATTTSVHLVKLARLARVVGATKASKDDEVYVLKLPLPALPKTSGRGKKI